MKVTSIRYFQTNRGVGYEAKTDVGSIMNDGDGGATYFRSSCDEGKKYRELPEWDLEEYINIFEGINVEEG